MSCENQHLYSGDRYLAIAAVILAVTACSLSVVAQPRDGEILDSKVRAPLPAFADLDDFGRSYFPRIQYEEARSQKRFDILDIQYASDGLEVPGVLFRPKNPGTSSTEAEPVTMGASRMTITPVLVSTLPAAQL